MHVNALSSMCAFLMSFAWDDLSPPLFNDSLADRLDQIDPASLVPAIR